MASAHSVAVVTGATSGIGHAIGLALARDGFIVCAIGTNPERLHRTRIQLAGCAAPDTRDLQTTMSADVTSEADMQRVVSDCAERFGKLDLLVASAGIGRKPGSDRVMPYSSDKLPLDEWSAVIDVNLSGIFLSNREAARQMIRQGHGRIINICSSTTPSGLRGTAYGPAYCASKFAVVGFTESLAQELAPRNVRAQAVFPGPVTTPLVDETMLSKPFGGSIPAEHFADAVVALAHSPGDTVVVHPHILPMRQAKS